MEIEGLVDLLGGTTYGVNLIVGGRPGKSGLDATPVDDVTDVNKGLIGNTEVVMGELEGFGDSGLLLLEAIWRPLDVAAEANAAWCKAFQCEILNKAGLRPKGFSRLEPKV